ncbi:MAG: metal-dependent hydrolase [Caldilineaceae bacterium]|nr:metal-dependent hydrolase [Caldilineaceae bacterium]
MSVKFTYYGHSTFAVETGGAKLVVDPFFAPGNPAAPVTVDQVEADYILLTHGHGDHTTSAPALAKRTGALAIGNFEVTSWMEKHGAKRVHGMNTGGAYTFPFGRVKMVVALHSSTMPDGSSGGDPNGLVIHFNDGHDVYIAGDTALTYDMKLIGEAGGVDLALLPIGDNFTMGPDDAILAAQFVKAKQVIPVHYETFPVIRQDAHAFASKLRALAEIDCTVLQPGESFILE